MKRQGYALVAVFAPLLALGVVRSLEATAPPPFEAMEASMASLRASTPPRAGGGFPARWNAGNDCANEPYWQFHNYNDDLYIIRQSKCTIFEAPFLYLIFGEDNVLLMDTGAVASLDVWQAIKQGLEHWSSVSGKAAPPLIVAHTHTHPDHIQGDWSFAGQPGVQEVVGLDQSSVESFWGFQDFPNDVPTIDLGNRVLDVLGTPGHQAASVTLYDRETQLLLTGDIVYPGHLFVFTESDWTDFRLSIQRLVQFAMANPVQWVLGCHIEFSNTPYEPYAWGTSVHPDEHELELAPDVLVRILRACRKQGADPSCTIYKDFVIHPVYKCGIVWNG